MGRNDRAPAQHGQDVVRNGVVTDLCFSHDPHGPRAAMQRLNLEQMPGAVKTPTRRPPPAGVPACPAAPDRAPGSAA